LVEIMVEMEGGGVNWRGPGVMLAGGRCAHIEGILRLGNMFKVVMVENTGALRGSVEMGIRGLLKGDWGAKFMAGELVWRARESDVES
jgi:hypothetical protein